MLVDVRKQKQNDAMIGVSNLYFMKKSGVITSTQKMVSAVESFNIDIDIIFVNVSVLI